MLVITFPHALNVSVQPKDTLYGTYGYATQSNWQSGSNYPLGSNKPKALGIITEVDHLKREIEVDTSGFSTITIPPYSDGQSTDLFYFFSKNRVANTSGLKGYYAEVEYRNNSKKAAEIFAVGAGYSSSSK